MAAARAIYGEQYNALLTLKALTYFGDGDLPSLGGTQKNQLIEIVSGQELSLPELPRIADRISTPVIR